MPCWRSASDRPGCKLIDAIIVKNDLCGCGETGRRARFRFWFGKPSVGSSPIIRTNALFLPSAFAGQMPLELLPLEDVVLLYAWPFPFVPLALIIIVFPSLETVRFEVRETLPFLV